jgi:hypothetical protein
MIRMVVKIFRRYLNIIKNNEQYKNYKPLPSCQIIVSNFNVVIYTDWKKT